MDRFCNIANHLNPDINKKLPLAYYVYTKYTLRVFDIELRQVITTN